jgi:hypothetical protein
MGGLVKLRTRGEHWLTKEQLASEIGYSTRWIEMQMCKGLPYLKPGEGRGARVRFRLSEVEAWMMRQSA